MSAAESIFYRKFFEVHSGADSVKGKQVIRSLSIEPIELQITN